MRYYETDSRVGPNGDLFIRLPAAFSNRTVHVRIGDENGSNPAKPRMSREEWLKFLDRVTGSITDPTFERPPQVVIENRLSFN